MSGQRLNDARIAVALRAHVPERAPAGLGDRVVNAVDKTPQQRPAPSLLAGLMNADPTARRRSLLIAAALLVGLAVATAAGVGALRLQQQDPPPELYPPPALIWTPAALDAPYPAPFRAEPSEGAPTVEAIRLPAAPGERQELAWTDPTGDVVPADDSRVDIVKVEFWRGQGCLRVGTLCVFYQPARLLESPLPDPQLEWIAYGMVVDSDRDGQPDGRFGIDNGPAGVIRAWHTDLLTERTRVVVGGNGQTIDGFYGESELPLSGGGTRPGRGYMWLTQGFSASPPEWNGAFYLWAAVIREGQIVSIDFAPDAGWLLPLPEFDAVDDGG